MSDLADQLHNLGPHAKLETVTALAKACPDLFEKYEINTPLRRCHFWAQAAHESGGFKYLTEIWGPTPAQAKYEGRKNLGNTQDGDGYLFRGRGIFQLTGRANYADMSKRIGRDLVINPELAAKPDVALLIACEYWKSRKLNALADADDVLAITKKINGGTNGLEDRRVNLARAKALWLREEIPGPIAAVAEPPAVEAAPPPPKTMLESKQGNGAIAIGALGSVGAVNEVVVQVQQANDVFDQIMNLIRSPNFLIMVAVVGIGAAIWYWRSKHMQEHGV
jgi:putative chitinase